MRQTDDRQDAKTGGGTPKQTGGETSEQAKQSETRADSSARAAEATRGAAESTRGATQTGAESAREATESTQTAADSRVGEGLLDEEMGPSSAFAHLYRGEVHRMKLWRERLDRTGNWSVLLMAAVLTWAFSDPSHPHYVLLVGGAGIGVFLTLEARRYRAYDIWRSRVRTLQRNVWTMGLHPDRRLADDEWRRRLAEDYAEPTLNVTFEEAIAHRLRRVYLPLFALVVFAWVLRVTAFAAPPWPASAATGSLSGFVVTGLVALTGVGLLVIAVRPRRWHSNDELRTELSEGR